jgi:hypothetical protein
MLDMPGWLDSHRLPNAVAVVSALKITARVSGASAALLTDLNNVGYHVRFAPDSDRIADMSGGPLRANSGHQFTRVRTRLAKYLRFLNIALA